MVLSPSPWDLEILITAILHASFLNFQGNSHLARYSQRKQINWPNEEHQNAKANHETSRQALTYPLGKVTSGVWQVESEVFPREALLGYQSQA